MVVDVLSAPAQRPDTPNPQSAAQGYMWVMFPRRPGLQSKPDLLTSPPHVGNFMGRILFVIALGWGVLLSQLTLTAAVFTVTNTSDSGPGSLRQAIDDANSTSGLDTIAFAIPEPGPYTIQPFTTFNQVTDAVVIDGTTQPGYAGAPLIELDGTKAGPFGKGFWITAAGCTIRGLAVGGFGDTGLLLSSDSNVIEANYVGLDPSGTVARPNGIAGINLSASAGNRVGGLTPSARNIISGNARSGILVIGISPKGAVQNTIIGNYIGTDPSGTKPLGNDTGVELNLLASDNDIGGIFPGSGNLISGNKSIAISIQSSSAVFNRVAGNLIGVGATGTERLPNSSATTNRLNAAVTLRDCKWNTIGGIEPEARNIISGNDNDGLMIWGNGSISNRVIGNWIGISSSGQSALGNGLAGGLENLGLRIGGGASLNLAQSNVVSGNIEGGVSIDNTAFENTLESNRIGTDSSGSSRVPNGQKGVVIQSSARNNIIRSNQISGNNGPGLVLGNTLGGNVVTGNDFGIDVTGILPLGNTSDAIFVGSDANTNNFIGTANRIAFNQGAGVRIIGGKGHRIAQNAIYSNTGLGIDLGPAGVTQNDSEDADSGPNGLQNFPTLSGAYAARPSIITGRMVSTAGLTYHLEFFASTNRDTTGFGEGQVYLGELGVDTANGDTFEFQSKVELSAGNWVTATATAPDGSTSEFSRAVLVALPSPPLISAQPEPMQAAPGTAAEFRAGAVGSPTLRYQWRKNGVNLEGETNPTLSLSSVQAGDGGSYSLAVANDAGAVESDPAVLQILLPALLLTDQFANRGLITSPTGTGSTNNLQATREANEGVHATKPGGKSMWIDWQAPADGVATFDTRGSAFDTLLAVYTGPNISSLVEIASDEDRGGFLTSQLQFNAVAGTVYHIVVDGFLGASGQLVLSWSLETTAVQIPVIRFHPQSQTVAPGASVSFQVQAEGTDLTYEWFRNGQPLSGETLPTLTRTSASPADVGVYRVRVRNAAGRTVDSLPASLELSATDTALSYDKLGDLLIALGLSSARPGLQALGNPFLSVAMGEPARHVLDNTGASTEPGEPLHGCKIGRGSLWLGLRVRTDGVLVLDNQGSSIETAMALYAYPERRVPVAESCGGDARRSNAVRARVNRDTTYLIAVMGAGDAQGQIVLNANLVTDDGELRLVFGRGRDANFQLRVSGPAIGQVVVQSSADLQSWNPVWTNSLSSAGLEWPDPQGVADQQRFYRARAQ